MRCLSIAALIILAVSTVADTGCSNGYSSFGTNKCYKVYSTLASRDAAATQCWLDGGNLASVHDGFTNSFIYSLATTAQASFIWLGTKCPGGNVKNCVNDDGTTFGPYSNFYPGNPNPISECVYMSSRNPAAQLWFSFDCTEPFAFACETPYGQVPSVRTSRIPRTTPTTTQTATTGATPKCNVDGFHLFENMCYAFVDSNYGTIYADAKAQCHQWPGGNVASIPDTQTNQFLHGLEDERNVAVWIGVSCPNVQYNGDTSSCVWADGTPLTFNGFIQNHPTVNGSRCVNFNNGAWTDTQGADCARGSNYFCQMPPVYV